MKLGYLYGGKIKGSIDLGTDPYTGLPSSITTGRIILNADVATALAITGTTTRGIHITGPTTIGIELRTGTTSFLFLNPSGPIAIAQALIHANVPANVSGLPNGVIYVNNYMADLPYVYKISDNAGIDDVLYVHQGTIKRLLNLESMVEVTECFMRFNKSCAVPFIQFKQGQPAGPGATCDTDGFDSDGSIKIEVEGVPMFIPYFNAAHTSGSW